MKRNTISSLASLYDRALTLYGTVIKHEACQHCKPIYCQPRVCEIGISRAAAGSGLTPHWRHIETALERACFQTSEKTAPGGGRALQRRSCVRARRSILAINSGARGSAAAVLLQLARADSCAHRSLAYCSCTRCDRTLHLSGAARRSVTGAKPTTRR